MRAAEKAIRGVQGFLEPGEAVRRVYLASGGLYPPAGAALCFVVMIAGQYLVGVGGLVGGGLAGLVAMAFMSRRVIVRTDRAVVVLGCGRFRPTRSTRVMARLPKETRVGPFSGAYAQVEIGGEKLWIPKAYQGHEAESELRLG